MEVDVKLYLLDESGKKYMGIGVMWLLENVEKHHSLRAASKEMGLSYSKALAMIKHLEKTEGKIFLIRKRGGIEREGAELTEYARKYIALYDKFQKEGKNKIREEFLKYKKDYDNMKEEYKDGED